MRSFDDLPLATEQEQIYLLKLYIAGDEQNSLLARKNLARICDEYLKGRCQIEEVNVMTDFVTALKNRIFVTPTLVLEAPEPSARIVGNLGDTELVVSALRLRFEDGT